MAASDAIDATKPVQGNPTTESVRDNFAATKSAIAQLELTAGVGPQGPIGNTGPTGPGATIAIGTVTTGAAGGNATVTNTGTATAATFNFTLPRGDSGTGGSGITETQAIDAVERATPVFKEEPETTAPNFPTSPNLAGVPVLGTNWTLATGTGATGGYDHATGSVEVLSYPMTFTQNATYQIVWSIGNLPAGIEIPRGVELLLRKTLNDDSDQQIVRSTFGYADQKSTGAGVHYGATFMVRPTRSDFTCFVVKPQHDFEGRFTLTRIVQGVTVTTPTLWFKNIPLTVRNDAIYLGRDAGFRAGRWSTAVANIGIGQNALRYSIGDSNIALGSNALQNNTTASNNVAIGNALSDLVSGSNNIAIGDNSLNAVASSSYNIGIGYYAGGYNHQRGSGYNIAIGCYSGIQNTTGGYNISMGYQAMTYWGPPQAGIQVDCIGIGRSAMRLCRTVIGTVAVGAYALDSVQLGEHNVAIGYRAGYFLSNGTSAQMNTDKSIFIGANTRGSATDISHNQIVIGNGAIGGGNDTITLGNDEITELRCNVQTISVLSDPRVKENIQPANLEQCLAAVKDLPVHRWKWSNLAGRRHDRNVTGFLSDEVKKVFPKAVTVADEYKAQRDEHGNVRMKTVTDVIKEGHLNDDGTWSHTTRNETREIEDRILIKDVARVAPNELLPTLWGAVQMLIDKNEALEREIADLKARR